jgi:deazaflavin-dependent oxidoreductase (nitroreductase family)
MAEELVRDGRVARITASGWRTGRPREVVAGFVAEPDGSILVAAGDDDASWGHNLLGDPECIVEYGDRRFRAVAEPLSDEEHALAIRELILRYGTPSERLGRGPSFRLRPIDDGRGA